MNRFSDRSNQELVELLRANDFLPVAVDGKIVQLVKYPDGVSLPAHAANLAVLSVIEIHGNEVWYTNLWETSVPFGEIPPKVLAGLDVPRETNGRAPY